MPVRAPPGNDQTKIPKPETGHSRARARALTGDRSRARGHSKSDARAVARRPTVTAPEQTQAALTKMPVRAPAPSKDTGRTEQTRRAPSQGPVAKPARAPVKTGNNTGAVQVPGGSDAYFSSPATRGGPTTRGNPTTYGAPPTRSAPATRGGPTGGQKTEAQLMKMPVRAPEVGRKGQPTTQGPSLRTGGTRQTTKPSEKGKSKGFFRTIFGRDKNKTAKSAKPSTSKSTRNRAMTFGGGTEGPSTAMRTGGPSYGYGNNGGESAYTGGPSTAMRTGGPSYGYEGKSGYTGYPTTTQGMSAFDSTDSIDSEFPYDPCATESNEINRRMFRLAQLDSDCSSGRRSSL